MREEWINQSVSCNVHVLLFDAAFVCFCRYDVLTVQVRRAERWDGMGCGRGEERGRGEGAKPKKQLTARQDEEMEWNDKNRRKGKKNRTQIAT